MKIYVDDTRNAPKDFVLANNYKSAINIINENKENIEFLSLDHDLGGNKSGYDICLYLVENEIYPKEINLHSANPVGVRNMYQLLDRYMPKTIQITKKSL